MEQNPKKKELTEQQRKEAAKKVTNEVNLKGGARVLWGIKEETKYEEYDIAPIEVYKVAAIIVLDNTYVREQFEKEPNSKIMDFFISRNPNYALNENLKWTNIFTLVFSAITTFYIAMEFYKPNSVDLKPISKQLQRIAQSQDSMRLSQKKINFSLMKVEGGKHDTNYVKTLK